MKKHKPLKNSKILIVSSVRNCARTVRKEIETISAAFSDSKIISWIIIESDSQDNTVAHINSIKNKYDIQLISLGNIRNKYSKRTQRIAICRNKYIDVINKNPKYNLYDYVVVADLDGVNYKLKKNSVNFCWDHFNKWDACFANQNGPYYDIWALRHNLWSPNDFRDAQSFYSNISNDFFKKFYFLPQRMITISKNYDPIKVESAFGGLGIYKKELFLNCYYKGVNSKGNEVCEHVHLHSMMRKKTKKFYIVPNLINSGWNINSLNSSLIGTILLILINLFSKLFTKN